MKRWIRIPGILLFVLCSLALGSGDPAPDLAARGLVNVQHLDPSIQVELKYSTTDNFLHADAYGELDSAFLQPAAAQMLAAASHLLQARNPELRLLVYDAARPRAVQRRMWKLVAGSGQQQYVANPERGSVHNFGAAVDLTITHANGIPLDMGTVFDYFGELAQPRFEEKFLKEGRLNALQVQNRKLLREVMEQAGFHSLRIEWWHFNAFTVKETRNRYHIIE